MGSDVPPNQGRWSPTSSGQHGTSSSEATRLLLIRELGPYRISGKEAPSHLGNLGPFLNQGK
jgi:hypothetical protein